MQLEFSEDKVGTEITAIVAIGIFKDYKADAPPSQHMLYAANRDIADFICRKLNALHDTEQQYDQVIAAAEGWEWRAAWMGEPVLSLREHTITTKEQAIQQILELIDPEQDMWDETETAAIKAILEGE